MNSSRLDRGVRNAVGIRMRKGQALVEFSICLPFIVLLLVAMVSFGTQFHRRQILNQVLRCGTLELASLDHPPSSDELLSIRRTMAFAGMPHGVQLSNVSVSPSENQGYLILSVSEDITFPNFAKWFKMPSKILVRTVLPVASEGNQGQ